MYEYECIYVSADIYPQRQLTNTCTHAYIYEHTHIHSYTYITATTTAAWTAPRKLIVQVNRISTCLDAMLSLPSLKVCIFVYTFVYK